MPTLCSFMFPVASDSDWKIVSQTDENGFDNVFLKSLSKNCAYCLALDHDSIIDCLCFHGVPHEMIFNRDPCQYKPWETRPNDVREFVSEWRAQANQTSEVKKA